MSNSTPMTTARIIPLPITEDDDYWFGPDDDVDLGHYEDDLDAPLARCPQCKGTGLDRWEQDDCTTCFGEGEVQIDLPIPESVSHRYHRAIYSTTT